MKRILLIISILANLTVIVTCTESSVASAYAYSTSSASNHPRECGKGKLKCKENEVLNECPVDCKSDYCPSCEGDNEKCQAPDPCPPPACKCRFNYRRADNGTCIPTRSCPPFECPDPNEEYNSCPPLCPSDDCSQASPSGECPRRFGRIGIVLECEPKCRCIKGYWRKNGKCVPYGECPGVCPRHERYSTCIQAECIALNCTQKNKPIACPSLEAGSCKSGCICEKNYLREANGTCVPEDKCELTCGENEVEDSCPAKCASDYCPTSESENEECSIPNPCPPPACECQFNYRRAKNGTCIPTRSCPPFRCTRPNEEYNSCPPLCPSDDCSQASPSGECPPVFGVIGIVLPCSPICRCIKNYWRKDGVCVPYGECPGVCPKNERYSTCIQAECRALNCTQKDESIPCPRVRPEACKTGCVCAENYLRAANGTCIPQDQCELKCGDNEVVDSCPAKDCAADYCPTSEDEPGECPTPDVCPPPACKCGFNQRRAPNGTCIPTKDCPPLDCSARPNEEYNSCPPSCPSDDCSQASPTGKCHIIGRIGIVVPCNPKCRCIKNYWRKDGICVPYDECPPSCPGVNEVYTDNKVGCQPNTCVSLVERFKCNATQPVESGCVCKSGYLRLNETEPCRPICECPQMENSPDCEN